MTAYVKFTLEFCIKIFVVMYHIYIETYLVEDFYIFSTIMNKIDLFKALKPNIL